VSLVLHGYWRSSAAYRVRIALNLKGLDYAQITHDLRTGAQRDPAYAALNPQGRVPTLDADGLMLTQSLAIIEWLEETYPTPRLLPATANDRAIVRAMAQLVACDIHPLNNLADLQVLRSRLDADEDALNAWIALGFDALETMIERHGGTFAFGNNPSLADCCLIPQVASAHRFKVDLSAYPRIAAIADHCATLLPFSGAQPDHQADADQ